MSKFSKEDALKKRARKLLAHSDEILQEVDEAPIFKTAKKRQFPSFARSELKFGEVLGVGGFCLVREIRQINLKEDSQVTAKTRDRVHFVTEPSPANQPEEEHYDVSSARRRMSMYCLRDGDARYAVKQMHTELNELEMARGMIDLAIEAKYLSVLSHPNIIKMRAYATCGPMHKGFFLVLDRLYGTLEEKLLEWKQRKKSGTGVIMGLRGNRGALKKLRIERLLVAYDLAAAFRYIHQQQIAYRDIKSENIGFDCRSDVKIFDFGLAKSLPSVPSADGMYQLTPRTGSYPYMAPENALGKSYNASVDVFSFGMLLWEIMALEVPFEGFSRREYHEKIVRRGLRPPVHATWPPRTAQMMKESWKTNPSERPDFRQIAALIRADLNTMTSDPEVRNRTDHMKERSLRSLHHRGAGRRAMPSEHGLVLSGDSEKVVQGGNTVSDRESSTSD